MTSGAQQALRRTMEIYSATTRFALACNNSSKIIEPIQSRCALLRFGRLPDEALVERLVQVAKTENVPYIAEGIEALVFSAEGDLRQAINNLQSTFSGFGYITPENVYRVCDQPHPTLIGGILEFCIQGELEKALLLLEDLCGKGYAPVDLVSTFFRVVKTYPNRSLSDPLQLEFIKEIGNTHVRILEGSPSKLQLSALICSLTRKSIPADQFTVKV
jgi:replication factor C subunit 2/4